ncbi:MAG: hypothetical protein MUC91_11130 [Verrucomicrobia bacterium]|jgi:hypothetical protein|nr:hypothetical protein [Verrucomicrobiota bacterium]
MTLTPGHRLLPAFAVGLVILGLLGCKSPSSSRAAEETIKSYEVILTTATNRNAEAVAELALVVEFNGERQTHEFSRKQYDQGERKIVKVKAVDKIPWKNRDELNFYLSTRSPDGYLPSHIWIAAISSQGNRFVLRDLDWKDQLLSSEPNDPEAEPPVRAAREWVLPHGF